MRGGVSRQRKLAALIRRVECEYQSKASEYIRGDKGKTKCFNDALIELGLYVWNYQDFITARSGR